MGIFIKNPEVERKARELARLKGSTLTAAIECALDHELDAEAPQRGKLTVEAIETATEKFRREAGLDKGPYEPWTKKDWDALWPIGIPEIDDA